MPEANEGVVSFIGLAGSWAGTGSVSCSPALACRICAQMLMCESSGRERGSSGHRRRADQYDHWQRQDRIGKHLGPLGLSIPTVVYGQNFKTKSAGNAEWIVVRFHWDERHA